MMDRHQSSMKTKENTHEKSHYGPKPARHENQSKYQPKQAQQVTTKHAKKTQGKYPHK